MSAHQGSQKSGLLERLRFRNACRRNDDEFLKAFSDPFTALKAELLGRSVAIVGNARALAETSHGPKIDAADIVVRINAAPMPSANSHGTRTDWLALAVSMKEKNGEALRPARIIWMSHKRKRLPLWVARRPGFFLYPLADFRALANKLGAPPTTGLMMIDFITRSGVDRVDLYGFDFFASLSLTGRRSAEQVPHDFAAEKAWFEELAHRDGRVRLN